MKRKLIVLCLMFIGTVLIVLGWTGVVGKTIQTCGYAIFAIGGVISWGIPSQSQQPPKVQKKVVLHRDTAGAAISVSAALEQLANAGVRMRPGISNDDLLHSLGGTMESPADWVQLLCVLGSEVERGEFERVSDDIWHFDTECIVDHGDYVTLLNRFAILAKGALTITNLRDFVDIEHGKVWVEFTLDGSKVHWDLEASDDWADPGL